MATEKLRTPLFHRTRAVPTPPQQPRPSPLCLDEVPCLCLACTLFSFPSLSLFQSLAEMFKPAEGSWECPGCYVNNNADVLRCLACQTVKHGAKPEEVKSPPKEDPFAPAAPTGGLGGLKFGGGAGGGEKSTPGGGGGGGFKFGAPAAGQSGGEKKVRC